MDNEQDKLENLFRDRFQNEELPIPEGMWERMRPKLPPPPMVTSDSTSGESSTDTNAALPSKPWIKIISALVVVAFLSGIVLYLVGKKSVQSETTDSISNSSMLEKTIDSEVRDDARYADAENEIQRNSQSNDAIDVPINNADRNLNDGIDSDIDGNTVVSTDNSTATTSNIASSKNRTKIQGTNAATNDNNSTKFSNVGRKSTATNTGANSNNNTSANTATSNINRRNSSSNVGKGKGLTSKQSDISKIDLASNSSLVQNEDALDKNNLTTANSNADNKNINTANSNNSNSNISSTKTSSLGTNSNKVSTTGTTTDVTGTTAVNNSEVNTAATKSSTDSSRSNLPTSNNTTVDTKSSTNQVDALDQGSNTDDAAITNNKSNASNNRDGATVSESNSQNINSGSATTNNATTPNSTNNSNNGSVQNGTQTNNNASAILSAADVSANKTNVDTSNITAAQGTSAIDSAANVDSIAVLDSIGKPSEIAQPDTATQKSKKEQQWRGKWIVELGSGASLALKSNAGLTSSSGVNYDAGKNLPGLSMQLDVFRKLRGNFMFGLGLSYQRNASSYAASTNRTETSTTYRDTSYYGQTIDSLGNVTIDTILTLDTIPVTTVQNYESKATSKIIAERWSLPIHISYQWRSGRIGMYTTLSVICTYYKYNSSLAQSGNDAPIAAPTLPASRLTMSIGGSYGVRYFVNQHFFVSGRVSYQSSVKALTPKSSISVQGGLGFEF